MHTLVLTLAVYVQYSLIYKVNRNSDLLMLTFPSTFWIFHQSFGGETDLRTPFSTLGSSRAFASCIAIFLTRGGWTFLKAGSYFGAETVPRDGHTNSHRATQQLPPWRASPSTCLSAAFSSLCFPLWVGDVVQETAMIAAPTDNPGFAFDQSALVQWSCIITEPRANQMFMCILNTMAKLILYTPNCRLPGSGSLK